MKKVSFKVLDWVLKGQTDQSGAKVINGSYVAKVLAKAVLVFCVVASGAIVVGVAYALYMAFMGWASSSTQGDFVSRKYWD